MGAPGVVKISPTGVSPSLNVSWTPDMNCRTLPVLNRLDQDPRDELEDDRVALAKGPMGDDGTRCVFGDVAGMGRLPSPRRDGLK